MKASELIKELQTNIEKHGDLDVCLDYWEGNDVTSVNAVAPGGVHVSRSELSAECFVIQDDG